MWAGMLLFRQIGGEDWYLRAMSSWMVNLFSFMAFGVAIAQLLARRNWIRQQRQGFQLPLLDGDSETLILPNDAVECRRRIRDLPEPKRRLLLVELLSAALQRSRANWSAEDASAAVQGQAELVQVRTDSEYAMVRYLAWAIPAIGFIGTVLGIGQAMAALRHLSGDSGIDPIDEATSALHLAFDTTFVALVLSLVLMFLMHRIQASDDKLIVRAADWCLRRFVYRMHIPKETRP